MSGDDGIYAMGDVVERTGVAEGTLRMWERRYGFPTPARLVSGHRRYSDRDIQLIRKVAAQRAAGYSLSAAIERAMGQRDEPSPSVYATLRRAKIADDRSYIDVQLRLIHSADSARLSQLLGEDFLVLMVPQTEPEPALEVAEPEPSTV